jgi:hypothetical protein
MGSKPSFWRLFKLGLKHLFSNDFIDETKSKSIDFFDRENSLVSPRMENYLKKASNKNQYINEVILKNSSCKKETKENEELASV